MLGGGPADGVGYFVGRVAGRSDRKSKSLTLAQAATLLGAAEASILHAYIVLSLLIGARTEDPRALRWRDVDLIGDLDPVPPVPPSISVVRSVRIGGVRRSAPAPHRVAVGVVVTAPIYSAAR